MAGISFSLSRKHSSDTYLELLRTYVVAGIIGSGPWILSMAGTVLLGLLVGATHSAAMGQFVATITHEMSLSLVVSGSLQLVFTRYVADRLFEKKDDAVRPAVLGALVVTALGAAVIAVPAFALLSGTSLLFRLLVCGIFLELCILWIASVMLTSLRAYKLVVALYGGAYCLTAVLGWYLSSWGVEGLLLSFAVSHAALVGGMLSIILRQYPSSSLLEFGFLRRKNIYPDLALIGIVYNLSLWIDKWMFWRTESVSVATIGPIRTSPVYDLPIFLSYVSMVPGMAVFLMRIELEFAKRFQELYDCIRGDGSLDMIELHRNAMVRAAKNGIFDILRVQGLTASILILIAPRVFPRLGIDPTHLALFNVATIASGVQVLVLGVLTLLFYLDYRREALGLTIFALVLNVLGTYVSLRLGRDYYGYGLAVAATGTALVGMSVLSRRLDKLEYDTFMR